MAIKCDDVVVRYYPNCAKHPVGCITFRDGLSNLIDASRVELIVSDDKILFKPNHDGTGLSLNFDKIQLASLYWIAKEWKGQYPLKYDIQSGNYMIMKDDKTEVDDTERIGTVAGTHKSYVARSGSRKLNGQKPVLHETEKSPIEKTILQVLSNIRNDNPIDAESFNRVIDILTGKQKGESEMKKIENLTLPEIDWFSKKRNNNRGKTADITISKIKGNNNTERVNFIFRNKCEEKLTKTGYLQFGTIGKRIYFKEATREEGFKVTHSTKDGPNKYIKSLDVSLFDFIGDYELLKDETMYIGMYYIEKIEEA